MSLKIEQNYITDLESFTWGKDWRATRIIKERRTDGEYYYANIVRYYGEKEATHDYDVGDTIDETAWLGRHEKYVGRREWITDPEDQTRRKRAYSEPITEIEEYVDTKGRTKKRTLLVEGRIIYEYTIKVNGKNTEKMKTLAGAIALNQETQFLFVYGAVPPHVVDPETFWSTTIKDHLEKLKTVQVSTEQAKKG